MDVFDFDGSGELEADERMAAAEILCTSAEEHEAFLVMQVILQQVTVMMS